MTLCDSDEQNNSCRRTECGNFVSGKGDSRDAAEDDFVKECATSEETVSHGDADGEGYESTVDAGTILDHIRRFESASIAAPETASPLAPERAAEDEGSDRLRGTAERDRIVGKDDEELAHECDANRTEPCDLEEHFESNETTHERRESPEQRLARKRRLFEQRENANPLVVTLRAHHGEEEIHSENVLRAIRIWRALNEELEGLKALPDFRERSTRYITCRDKILSVEIDLIEKHGLTIATNLESDRRAAWDGFQRNERAVVRKMTRARLKEEFAQVREEELREASIKMLNAVARFPLKFLTGLFRNRSR